MSIGSGWKRETGFSGNGEKIGAGVDEGGQNVSTLDHPIEYIVAEGDGRRLVPAVRTDGVRAIMKAFGHLLLWVSIVVVLPPFGLLLTTGWRFPPTFFA
jgi:hypothetical protein